MAITLLAYQNAHQVYQWMGSAQLATVVVPSPELADIVRQSMHAMSVQTRVLTYHEFLQAQLRVCLGSEGLKKMVGKSELMIQLYLVWRRHHGPGESIDDFLTAYTLFTDLRSFTLNFEMQSDLFEGQREEICQVVLLFAQVMEALGSIDEHLAHQLLTQQSGTAGALDGVERLLFWGFKFFSGMQIDYLKHLAAEREAGSVVVAMPYDLTQRQVPTDWLTWLGPTEQKILSGPSSPGQRYIYENYFEILPRLQGTNTVFVSSDFEQSELFARMPLQSDVQTDIDLYSVALERLMGPLIGQMQGRPLALEELMELLRTSIRTLVGQGGRVRELKVVLLFYRVLEEMLQMSDQFGQTPIDGQDLRFLRTVVRLRLPRVEMRWRGGEREMPVRTLEQAMLMGPMVGGARVLIVDRWPFGHQAPSRYPEGVLQRLAAIGPVRTAQYERSWLQALLAEQLKIADTVYFQREVLAHRAFDLLIGQEVASHRFPTEKSVGSPVENSALASTWTQLQTGMGDLVAQVPLPRSYAYSALQSYADCPLQYYQNYRLRLPAQLKLVSRLTEADIGLLEHRLIKAAFEQLKQWNPNKFSSLLESVVRDYLEEAGKTMIPLAERRSLVSELRLTVRATVEYLFGLRHRYGPDLHYRFEWPLAATIDGTHYQGKADLIIENRTHWWLVDFKRSSSSIPTSSELIAGDAFQIWHYAMLCQIPKKFAGFAYLCLKDFTASLGMWWLQDDLNWAECGFKCASKPSEIEPDVMIQAHQAKCRQIVQRIEQGEFRPSPRTPKSCEYCYLKSLCDRGEKGAQQ